MKHTTKITLTARCDAGGSATIEFSEAGAKLLADTRKANYGYLHLTPDQMELPAPSAKLQTILARYYMRPEADQLEMLGLPPRAAENGMGQRDKGFIRPPAGGATICRWAFKDLGPDGCAKLAGLNKMPAIA